VKRVTVERLTLHYPSLYLSAFVVINRFFIGCPNSELRSLPVFSVPIFLSKTAEPISLCASLRSLWQFPPFTSHFPRLTLHCPSLCLRASVVINRFFIGCPNSELRSLPVFSVPIFLPKTAEPISLCASLRSLWQFPPFTFHVQHSKLASRPNPATFPSHKQSIRTP